MPITPTKKTREIGTAPANLASQSANAPAGTFGEPQARAVQDVARGIQRVGDVAGNVALDMQRREDETRLLEYQTQLESYETESLFTGEDAILNRKGSNSFGTTKTGLEDFDTYATELGKSLTNEGQRQQAKKLRARFRNGYAKQVSRHEASQRRVWEEATRSAAIETAADRAVLYYSNSEQRAASLSSVEKLIRDDSQGLPPEAIEQRIQAEKTKIHASIIDRYSLDNIGAAEGYYRDNKDEIDPDAYLAIEKSFKVIRNQQAAAARKEINDQIQVVQDTFKMGIEVPESQVNALKSVAQKNGLDQQAQALQDMQDVFDVNQQFLDTPLPEQPEVINELRRSIEEKPTRAKLAKYQILNESFQTKVKQLQDDPAQYYLSRKELRPFKQIDPSNPVQMGHEINQRRISLAQIEQKEGVRIPVLRKEEMDQFAQQYTGANATQKTALLMNMKATFTPDEARTVAQKMAPKQKSLAAVMSIVHEAPDVAERIAAGNAREKFVTRSKVSAAVQEYMAGAVQDGAAIEAITDSVHDLYTQLAFESKDTTNEVDVDRVKEAVEQITGPKVKVKTKFFGTASNVLPFRKETGQFITASEFDSVLETVDLKRLMEVHGDTFKLADGTTLDPQETIGRSEFITVGDGQYHLRLKSGQTITDGNGQPFVLNVKELSKGVDTRGLFGKTVDSLNRTELDDYVEAQRNIKELIEQGASQKKIDAARQRADSLEGQAKKRAAESKIISKKYGG